ncbi:MAG: hypothetical protein LC114_25800, partial [Bryobacterales bacterium]|nr:hypothetical protein [Bryobacterales bacterium]
QLGQGDARLLLRYQVSELNRFYFAMWERAQLILGTALLLVLTRKPRRKRFLITALLMLAIVAATHWLLSPEITRIGRLMDFVDGARQTADGQTFWRLHQTYATLEVLKFLLGGYLTFLLFTAPAAAPSPSDGTGREVNFINDRKHSGVDG